MKKACDRGIKDPLDRSKIYDQRGIKMKKAFEKI